MAAPVNTFKAALKHGNIQIGCWAGFGDAYATEITATAGFDWLLIDGEHAPNDLRSISAQVQVISASASHPIIRLPEGGDAPIKQALDIGAQTLLIPMVESADQARAHARSMRYPPEGVRGSGAALARATLFSQITEYVETANDQVCLLVQLESRAGLAALDEILTLDGIDGVFIGPSDLAVDMGYPGNTEAPEVQAAIKDALTRIAASGKAAGCLAVDDAAAKRYLDWGAQFLAVGIDVLMLANAARAKMAHWKKATT
ncbi:MAG: HpcH/HpaI aldolase/citrate lyase family protein [Rhodobacterales bacterium]|nr:HpcH/HpaI aldolase/citrate lyase family protein [Rhodobacterales bacterium]